MSVVESAEQLNTFLEKINILCEKLMVEDCPICGLKLTEDKVTCANGHGICASCNLVVNVCPECTATFPENETAQGGAVGAVGVHPPPKRPRQSADAMNTEEDVDNSNVNGKRCANTIRGCRVSLDESELAAHEAICPYRAYLCKLCNVSFGLRNLQGHCERSHGARTIKNNSFNSVTRDVIASGDRVYYFIQAHNEFFWFWRNNTDSLVHFGLQYCGDAERTKEFKYSLEVVSMNQKSTLKFRGPVLFDTSEMPGYTLSDEYVMVGKNLIGVDSKFKVTVNKV